MTSFSIPAKICSSESGRPADLLHEEAVVVDEARRVRRIELAPVDQPHERVAVALRQQQLVAGLDALVLVVLLKEVVLGTASRRSRLTVAVGLQRARSASSSSEMVVSRCWPSMTWIALAPVTW